MNHQVLISFDFDDETVKRNIEQHVEKEVIGSIKLAVEKCLYGTYWRSDEIDRKDTAPTKEFIKDHVEKIINDNKDMIIECAIERIVEKIKNSKAFKEKLKETTE